MLDFLDPVVGMAVFVLVPLFACLASLLVRIGELNAEVVDLRERLAAEETSARMGWDARSACARTLRSVSRECRRRGRRILQLELREMTLQGRVDDLTLRLARAERACVALKRRRRDR